MNINTFHLQVGTLHSILSYFITISLYHLQSKMNIRRYRILSLEDLTIESNALGGKPYKVFYVVKSSMHSVKTFIISSFLSSLLVVLQRSRYN